MSMYPCMLMNDKRCAHHIEAAGSPLSEPNEKNNIRITMATTNARISKSHYYLHLVLITVYWYYPGTPPKRAIDHVRFRSDRLGPETAELFAKELPDFLKSIEAEQEN